LLVNPADLSRQRLIGTGASVDAHVIPQGCAHVIPQGVALG
jgi:hypothetical protein